MYDVLYFVVAILLINLNQLGDDLCHQLAESENGAASFVILWIVAADSNLLALDNFHFAPQIVSFHMIKALAHIGSHFQVYPGSGHIVLSDER